jgi:hypothetical protein
MGASTFGETANGKTAKEAFRKAVEQAQFDYGHAGYTGSIAEKSEFVMIDVPAGKNAYDHAHDLIDDGDPRIDDKWGPAGCIKLDDNTWYFFGWASS